MPESRICPSCREEMALRYKGVLYMKEFSFAPAPDYIGVEMYRCPRCRRLEWVEPLTPVEQFEQEQQALESQHDPVKKFEILFADYPAKKLQKVIDGRDYLPEAKEAARNLLRKREE